MLVPVPIALNALLLVIALVFEKSFGYPAEVLYRDPNAVAKQPFVIGWFSTLGVLAWATAATCALFAGALAHRAGRPALGLLCFGVLSALLCLDDALMLHEEKGLIGYLGLPETPLYALYTGLLLFGLARWRVEDPRAGFVVPFLALACLAASLSIDQLADIGIATSPIVEDVAKSVGLSYWAVFVVASSWRTVTASKGVAPAPDGAA